MNVEEKIENAKLITNNNKTSLFSNLSKFKNKFITVAFSNGERLSGHVKNVFFVWEEVYLLYR
ncbi:hypothetical protein G9O61_00g001770 [Vairimorpha ceranae]|nr:hypothetical protein G9O61_00g001770 [Vairimorpha ceranae]